MTGKPPRLEGTSWVLVSLAGIPPVADTEITATFGTDRRVSGSAGCNRYTGAYEISGPSIEVGPLASTRMYCPTPGVMEQEQRYLVTLEASVLAAVEGDQLLLADAGGTREILFSRLNRTT
jgi:heat shock protein HslJ